MRLPLWPQSLFGRLLAATVCAVVLAEVAALFLIAQEHERFVQQWSVREWARRVAETTLMLQPLSPAERAGAVERLLAAPPERGHWPLMPPGDPAHPPPGYPAHPPPGPPGGPARGPERGPHSFIPLPVLTDFDRSLRDQLRPALGPGYAVEVRPTPAAAPPAIAVSAPFLGAHEVAPRGPGAQRYDVSVRLPDGGTVPFRVIRMSRVVSLPRHLLFNLTLLVLILVIVLYVTARSITRPLSALARAADRVGRDARTEPLAERGARELRHAARAFNTMQDRLRRYLDSRTRVLAAMSHDLKTPLTRLRLQVETLDNPPMQERIGRELDEMEAMVREALALFRGIEDGEPPAALDLNALLDKVREEFTDMGRQVTLAGHVVQPLTAKPQALKRCLTNLVANATTFGARADILVEDGPVVAIRVRDRGPGIPARSEERRVGKECRAR